MRKELIAIWSPEAERPATSRFRAPLGTITAQRDVVGLDHGGEAGTGAFEAVGPVVVVVVVAHRHCVGECAGVGDVVLAQHVFTNDAPPLASPDVRETEARTWVSSFWPR